MLMIAHLVGNLLLCTFQAADYLEQAEYDTGNPDDDLKTQSLMRQLLYNPKLQAACPIPFDEAKLWKGENGPELKQQIQKQFRNIRSFSNPYLMVVLFQYQSWTFLLINRKKKKKHNFPVSLCSDRF